MASKDNNQISPMDFYTLQIFCTLRNIYETFKSFFKWSFWQRNEEPHQAKFTTLLTNSIEEKRHFIQLYRTEPTTQWEEPICYMNVTEFDNNSCSYEELRKRKLSCDFPYNNCNNNNDDEFHQLGNLHHHRRTHSDNKLQRFYCSNLRY